jgi:hypothetical protein
MTLLPVNRTRGGWRIPDQNLWTGEVHDYALTFSFDTELRLSYEDPRPDDWERGVLWLRHGQDRTGGYKWRAINTPRTRTMMRSSPCRRPDGRIWWLFVTDPATTPDGTPITNLPPTCSACLAESLITCPRLVERSRLVTVADAKPYGVTADVYAPGEGFPAPAVKVLHEIAIPYVPENEAVLRFALGKQPWVSLEDMRDEPLPGHLTARR